MSESERLKAGRYRAAAKHVPGEPRRLGHGVRWSFINTLVTKLAGIAVTVVVVRIVTPHDFGVFAVALVVYAIVAGFGELGLSAGISRREADPAVAGPVVTALSMISSSILAIAMVVAAHPVATLLGAPQAEAAIRVLAICIFLNSTTAVSSAILVRDFRQGRLFAATAIAFVPANLVLVLLALNGDGALAFAWSRVVGQVVAGGVVIIAAGKWYRPKWNRAEAVKVLTFGLPLAGANILNYMLLNADFAFIGSLLGAALLGIYTLAFNVASWSTSVLGGTINGVAMPALSALRTKPAQLRETMVRWSRLVALLSFPVSALTAVLAADIVQVLYGSTWARAAPVLSVLALYGAVFVVSLLFSNLLIGVGRAGRVFIIQAIWLVSLLITIALGVRFFGVEGAAIAHVVVILLVVVPMYLWAVRPVLPKAPSLIGRAVAGPFVAAVIAGAAALGGRNLVDGAFSQLLVGGVAGVLVFLLLAMPMIGSVLPERIQVRLAPILSVYAWRPRARAKRGEL